MSNKKIKTSKINQFISELKILDKYILDNENAIIVIKNNKKVYDQPYIMIHERLVNDELIEIGRWYIDKWFTDRLIRPFAVIEELNLFQVPNGKAGNFNALYDYKNDKFIIPCDIWDKVEVGPNNEYVNRYNGYLASFEIRSDYEKGDIYSYINPVTNESFLESFVIEDGTYYAIINIDGTIRGNKLFKGKNFSKITEIIDLSQYESIMDFKNERKQFCNEEKKKRKQEYQQMIQARNDGSISPYLDSEVAKILELKI